MPLESGTRLGPYEIVAPIGAGGMGEVYRALDTRITRQVVVKILPRAFAENADRLRRFEQEARATAAVNHPNLLTVFDVGTHEGLPFIVSELLEGATLRDRLVRPLTARKAIDYAVQIARAIGAAHEKGIVHRDLKPDNIFITEDERVKLLDFGLAKLFQSDQPADASKTARRQDTAEGTVVGTVAYMSPEQVRGQTIDHRTDVFSFGIVLYEMLSGAQPFKGPSSVETMAAIIHDEPPPLPSTSPSLERIVHHAMEKSPSNRFQSMKDVVFALDTFSGSGETSALPAKKSRSKKKETPSRELPYRRITFRRGFVMTARFAPDGSVIYGATWEDQPQEIYSVIPGNPESRPVGFPNADILAVSPTGELAVSLGRHFVGKWVTSGTLARAPLFGGAPRELSTDIQDADWIDARQLAVIRHTRDGHVIEAPLGTVIHESQHWISNLRMSPRGDRLAFQQHDLWGDDAGRVVILDLRGHRVAESNHWGSIGGLAWTPGGEEVWTGAQRGPSVRDLCALSLTGRERMVLSAHGRLTMHDIARDGRVLFSVENGRREIMAGTHEGESERNLSWMDWSFLSGMSPDGTGILFEEQAGGQRGENSGVYFRNVDGSAAVRLGEGTARSFSPDGVSIGVRAADADYLEIVPIKVGTASRVPLADWEEVFWWDWTPNGKQMIVWGHQPGGASQHFAIVLDGRTPPRAISPEGSKYWFAIAPDSAGLVTLTTDDRLIIVPFDGSDPRPVPGAEEGDRPVQWSADGESIFVYKPGRVQVSIDRLELSSGRRSRWQLLRPGDPAGIMDIHPITMTRDGASYAYSYRRFMSDLYVVDGLA